MGDEGQRTGPGAVAVAALAGAVLLFLIAPVVIILIVSFSGADYLRFPPPSLSLRWYQRFFGIAAWRQAIGVSTQVAFLTMVFATVLGFLASLALVRGRFHLQLKSEQPTGIFTLILRKTPAGWRIIHDHTSS